MPTAIARFVELLRETCPDLVVHAGADRRDPEHLPRRPDVRGARREVNRILGTDLAADDLPPLLDPIGYTVTGDGDTRTVALPSWRLDSTEEIDVIEEVARHYGYDRLGKTVPKSVVHGNSAVRSSGACRARRAARLGISEAMPNPFLAPDTLAKAGLAGRAITITNPLVIEESVLRTSLRPGCSRRSPTTSRTADRGPLFEIGHVYPPGRASSPTSTRR